MSKVKTEAIWQHEKVLPYILTCLKDRISEITTVEKIMLFGSRGRIPQDEWHILEGKDWDVLVQAGFRVKNANILVNKEYHLDLIVLNSEQVKEFCRAKPTKELFPTNEIKL